MKTNFAKKITKNNLNYRCQCFYTFEKTKNYKLIKRNNVLNVFFNLNQFHILHIFCFSKGLRMVFSFFQPNF